MEKLSEEMLHHLDEISRSCMWQKITLSVAESVTSGYLQLLFSNAKNATCFFQGGITTYNGGQKTRHLDVEPIYAMESNCVDKAVTEVMAARVRLLFCSHIGIAITGYATPIPADGIEEIYAWVAIAGQEGTMYSEKITPADRHTEGLKAQAEYAVAVLRQLSLLLNGRPHSSLARPQHG
jgi:PncC family amidohydrolase